MDVDASTIKNWNSIPDENCKRFILDSVTIKNSSNPEYTIRQKSNGECLHLDHSGLCNIQTELGHSFLPETCQSYPRARIHKDNINLLTAHLSCPAIAGLLSNTTIKKLIKNEQDLYYNHNEDMFGLLSRSLHAYINRLFIDRDLTTGMSLFLLTVFLADIIHMAQSDALDTNSLSQYLGKAISNLDNDKDSIKKLLATNSILDNEKKIDHFLYIVHNSLLVKYIHHLESKLNVTLLPLTTGTLMQWQASGQSGTTSHILKNYIYLKFINHGFPWNPFKNSHAATFLDCIFPWIICQNVIINANKQNINIEDTSRIIYSVEKLNAHNFDNFEIIGQHQEMLDFMAYNKVFLMLA